MIQVYDIQSNTFRDINSKMTDGGFVLFKRVAVSVLKHYYNICGYFYLDKIRRSIHIIDIVHFNVDELREICRLATSISNNINQILVNVDRNDDSFDSDIADIKEKMHQIWQALIYFQGKNLQLKH